MQAEIDGVIGPTRHPTMADRPNLPFTDAVIHEIQRVGNVVPLNGLRMAAKDTTLGGYFIPKVPLLLAVGRTSKALDPESRPDTGFKGNADHPVLRR